MTRPTTERRGGPAYGVDQKGSQVSLEVNAPLNVQARDGRAEGLARALGVANEAFQPIAANKFAEQRKKDSEEAVADATFGKPRELGLAEGDTALSRFEEKYLGKFGGGLGGLRKKSYGEAYDRTAAVKAFQASANKVMDWVNTDGALIKDPNEFAAELEARMQGDLGSLIDDPNTAAEIAKRYEPFITNLSGQHRARVLAEFQQEALDTAGTDVVGRLARGEAVDIGEEVGALAPQLGARSKAVAAVVGWHQQAALEAARSGDPEDAQARADAILEALNADGTDDNGKPLRGPGHTAKYQESLQKTREDIATITDERTKGKRLASQTELLAGWQDEVDGGNRISLERILEQVEGGILSREQGLEWYRKGYDAEAKVQGKRDRTAYLIESADRSHTLLTDANGEAIPASEWSEAMTRLVQAYPEEQQFQAAMEWTAKTGIPYKQLQDRLNLISTADPKDLASLHDEYEQIKARGLATDYLKPDTIMKYERYSDLMLANVSPEVAIEELRRSPEESEVYFKRFEKDLRSAQEGTDVFGVTPGDDELLNSPYVARLMDTYATLGLRNGLSPERAAEEAKKLIEQGHIAVDTKQGTIIIPKVAGVSEESMQWVYNDLLPEVATAKGLDAEQLRFVPVGPNGELILTDQSGIRVTPEVWTLTKLGDAYKQKIRDSAYVAVRDKNEMERLRKSDPDEYKVKVKQAAIERQNRQQAELRKYTQERADKVVGGANNLPDSAFAYTIPKVAGGQRGRATGRAQAAAAGKVMGGGLELTLPPDAMPSAMLELAPAKLVAYTLGEAEKIGVPADIAFGVTMMESSGGKFLRAKNNSTSARGPLHILEGTFAAVNAKHFDGNLDWDDVRHQTVAGLRYLQDRIESQGDVEKGVLAYFMGDAGLREHIAKYGDAWMDTKPVHYKNGKKIENASPRQYLNTVRAYAQS